MEIQIDESVIEATLKEKLGKEFDRALKIFQQIDKRKWSDLVQILAHASDKDIHSKIISDLEGLCKKEFFEKADLDEIDNILNSFKGELGIEH